MQSIEEEEQRDCHHQETQQDTVACHSATINLKMLSLNHTPTQPPLPSSSSAASCCTACGSSKRRSPSSSFVEEPSAKKQLLTLLPPPHSATANFSPPSPAPILRRCNSDAVNSPGTKPQSPENATSQSLAKLTASLPPLPPRLRRSVTHPPSHSPSSGELGSGSRNRGGESPSSKRLTRLKDGMEELIQLWEQVMGGEEEDNNGCPDCNASGTVTEVEETETEKEEEETEEAVSVEKTGECLVIRFKCPCQKDYQILLSGKNCFYKL